MSPPCILCGEADGIITSACCAEAYHEYIIYCLPCWSRTVNNVMTQEMSNKIRDMLQEYKMITGCLLSELNQWAMTENSCPYCGTVYTEDNYICEGNFTKAEWYKERMKH